MKRVLGIDLGDARTGLALSDELRMLAHPLETIESDSIEVVVRRLQVIMSQKNIDCVVVGLPRNMDGSLGKRAEQAQRFVEKLRAMTNCDVITWDERLSTVAANRALQAAGKKTRHTKSIRDQVAAQIILQSYLDRLNA